jgi:hypothetical protein
MKTLKWRNVPEQDIHVYARSYHAAAKRLAGMLDSTSLTALDLCPVLSAYRKAVELSLKVVVLGEGSNFLPTKPDSISVHKTRSVSWLAQFVCQIITTIELGRGIQVRGSREPSRFQIRARGRERH